MFSIFLKVILLSTMQIIPAEAPTPDLDTIGVVLGAVSNVLGIISIALTIWQMKRSRKKN